MGALCDGLFFESAADKTEIKTTKQSTRFDILKNSVFKTDCVETSSVSQQNKTQNQYPYLLKESFNPFPQLINEQGQHSTRFFCQNNPAVYREISFDQNNNLNCPCSKCEISQDIFTIFLNKFSIGNYKNHKCDLHQIEGEYCLVCNTWMCGKCMSGYHNKHYTSHHFVSFKSS